MLNSFSGTDQLACPDRNYPQLACTSCLPGRNGPKQPDKDLQGTAREVTGDHEAACEENP